jgi:hypothetical protein
MIAVLDISLSNKLRMATGMGMTLLLDCGTLTDDDCKDWPARRLEYCCDAETYPLNDTKKTMKESVKMKHGCATTVSKVVAAFNSE